MLLQIRNLKVYFYGEEDVVKAVDGANLEIAEGEILALVGESGSGKTLTGLAVTKLTPKDAKIIQGEILFNGVDLLKLDTEQIRDYRGGKIAYIFQEPAASFNPVFTIGEQILEAINLHRKLTRSEAKELAVELLISVGISSAKMRFHSYPHQLSGGLNQRAMIAMALACQPRLLIADEPTTALDLTIQAQILDLLEKIRQERKLSILFITHNLDAARQISNRIAVLHKGKIVECGTTEEIFTNPKSEWTKRLMENL